MSDETLTKTWCAVAKIEDDRKLFYGRTPEGEWFLAFQDKYDTPQLFRPGKETGEKWAMLLQMAYNEGERLIDHPYGVTMVSLSWFRKDSQPDQLELLNQIERFMESNPPQPLILK